MKWCMSARSSGKRKSPGCAWSMTALRCSVYLPVGLYGGGRVGNVGMSFSGSPLTSRVMRNLLGSSVLTGRIFRATGLYFFPAYSGLKNRCNVWQFWSGCDVALDEVRIMLSVGGVK